MAFRRVLVANRGEIAIRVFRALTELGKETVAIYSREDTTALHRYKADEAYLIGDGKGPVEAYLDIDGIVRLCLERDIDAVHPGYGFLSENPEFAAALEAHGIAFIGPTVGQLRLFGDKAAARQAASEAGLSVLPASPPVEDVAQAREAAARIGYPVLLKALAGGGGRGQRVVWTPEEMERAFESARSEAAKAFGRGELYVERYLSRAKHVEVQVLGDTYGNLVHLYERDCSVQRRHQKIVEIAPAFTVPERTKEEIREKSIALLRHTGYQSAGTVEFLVDEEGRAYFLEVNPRIQVEHTVTELVTGVDLVQAQILVAEGLKLSDPPLSIRGQEDIQAHGVALQCRITTEDPENGFIPDTGRIIAYRSAAGNGVRLDTGNVYVGADVSPHYDSLLVKVSTWDRTFEGAVNRMRRALREFRIRGVKTNIPFLLNLLDHPTFRHGACTTTFVENHPELTRSPEPRDRGTKLLRYIAERAVAEERKKTRPEGIWGVRAQLHAIVDRLPKAATRPRRDFRRLLLEEGAEAVVAQVAEAEEVLITDTTFRDAHQSLLATRMRTRDLVAGARATAALLPDLFSVEVWGGATFDVCLGMLKECPWERLEAFREAFPYHLLQMLLRGQNGVGYEAIPDNLLDAFIREAVSTGVDLFRIFDSLNWVEGMRPAIAMVREAGKIAEAAICYTGDILDPHRERYTLAYYVDLAKELKAAGAQLLAIKDMAGLLTPYAAFRLVRALKEEVGLPVHLHTHDTSGAGIATLLKAIEAGVDIVDVAQDALSGLTSQPPMGSLLACLRHTERDPRIDLGAVHRLIPYWETARRLYAPFESGLTSPSSEVYVHEMPGGQYSNLRQQAIALGLGDRWEEVKAAYRTVNEMLGDIVKVTPSSKMVGDFALFMVEQGLTPERLLAEGGQLSFPESVVSYFRGLMGQPPYGFPEELRALVLKGRTPVSGRPGAVLPPVDLEGVRAKLQEEFGEEVRARDAISYALYPRATEEFLRHRELYGDTSSLDTATFFYGLEPGEETSVDIEPGKTLFIRLNALAQPQRGVRSVFFELNGHTREIRVAEVASQVRAGRPKANPRHPEEIGAPMPGRVLKLFVQEGQEVEAGQPLFVMEAMKMETTVVAPQAGTVAEVLCREGEALAGGDLVLRLRLKGLD